MENIYKEVDFKTYCKTCEHKDLEEKFDSGKFKFGITINPVYFSSSLNEFDGIGFS